MSGGRFGIWLIGACGGVASTATLGLAALRRQAIPKWGLVSELPQFAPVELPRWEDFVVGGHEIRAVRLADELRRFARENAAFREELVDLCATDLEESQANIRWGTVWGATDVIRSLAAPALPQDRSAAEAIERLERDIRSFRESHHLDHVVVIHVASTEPPFPQEAAPTDWEQFRRWLALPEAAQLPPSTLYAIAAFRSECSYINFTPSVGPELPAVRQLAADRGCCYMGCDGKTGETLLKSVLGPLFAQRNLQVLSWVGHNIFGNLDGRVLDHPQHKASKVATKDRLLPAILGYKPQTHVSIEWVESLGDWKTAWDHVHFAGFLGTKMILQFIWQGCDSVLAAPLVLDLARWSVVAWKRGHRGVMPFLASYFKRPYGVDVHDFYAQFQMLVDWALGQQGPGAKQKGEA